MSLDKALRARLEQAGQEFLIEHAEHRDADGSEKLVQQLEGIDFDLVARLRAGEGLAAPATAVPEPVPCIPFAERGPHTAEAERGREELRAGRVAFAVLAGGQASRLRWDGPKGTFPVGPVSNRSLFQILAEHLRRAVRDHGVQPFLAVTTSSTTDLAIRAFFERSDCFGLDRSRLAFARQESLPVLDEDGHLMLASPDRVFTSPDGHGGAVLALAREGVLERWVEAGVTTVCSVQIDNPLLRVVDPDFVGRLVGGDADIATKIVMKRHPWERVGIVARVGGRPAIVEYSELSKELSVMRDGDGRLHFRLGSIGVHAFRLDFLQRELGKDLPLHAARKEIPAVDPDGVAERRPGVKYERFVFDLFPRARDVCVVEVLRAQEYAAIKNEAGEDSPESVRTALDREYRRWYREAGRPPPAGEMLELSPLDALGPEDLGPGSATAED